MSFTSKGTAEIIVAGLQDVMLVVDVSKGEVVKEVGRPLTSGPQQLTVPPRCRLSISIPS
jgi:hypothetical protein